MTTQNTAGDAAQIKVLTSNSMRAVMGELVPQFERASGNKVAISYDPAKLMLTRIRSGETADVVIIGSSAIDELTKEGRIAPDTCVVLARCSIGMAVRAGAAKPDIGSVEAFQRTLLKAKSIAHTINGASGMHFTGLIERLGIAEDVKSKARRRAGGLIGELVASGEAEIAIQQIPELLAVPGIDLVGPIPAELQKITVVAAGIFRDAGEPQAARALLEFLSTPAAARVIKAKGLEPAGEKK
ncbi:MAG: substrate-binding domain-containing protein [Betaproteobacteria bacterium]|nr:substrate-binding domain-containing protein [Betaproteobacteria bacterium]